MGDTGTSPHEIQRGAAPVNDDLEVGFDSHFEHQWRVAEIAGRVIMVLVIAGGLAGLMGRGPFSHHTDYSPDHMLGADFEPVARWGTPTVVTLHVRPPKDGTHVVTVQLASKFIEPMGLTRIWPQPSVQRSENGDLLLTLDLPPDGKPSMVRLDLRPLAIGPVALHADIVGGDRVDWTQVILP